MAMAMSASSAPPPSPPLRSLNDLPFEIIYLIASHLRPRPPSSIHPSKHARSIDDSLHSDEDDEDGTDKVIGSSSSSSSYISDILALAYTSRKCYFATLPAMYTAPVLLRTRQARLLAESLTQRYQPKTEDLQEYNAASRQIKHLYLPNDGMLIGKDQLSDQAQWAPSLRTILANAPLMDSALISSRTDGAALSELLGEEAEYRPRRLTILNYYSSPPFSMYNLRPLSQLTHLHLINLIPRDAIINLLAGRRHGPHPLTHLRLSQLHAETLHDFESYITWRRASEAWDKQRSSTPNTRDPAPPRPAVPARRFEAQETLYALAVASATMPALQRLTLELSALAPLPEPEDVPLLGDETTAPAQAPMASFGQIGDDVGFGDESTDIVNEAERTRTASRDAYWIDVRDNKEALRGLFAEMRRGPPPEIRVVAPRPGGWDQRECRREFDAQVAACEGSGSVDATSFEDPDVFDLGEQRPELASREGWWDGMLPRFNAGDGRRR